MLHSTPSVKVSSLFLVKKTFSRPALQKLYEWFAAAVNMINQSTLHLQGLCNTDMIFYLSGVYYSHFSEQKFAFYWAVLILDHTCKPEKRIHASTESKLNIANFFNFKNTQGTLFRVLDHLETHTCSNISHWYFTQKEKLCIMESRD